MVCMVKTREYNTGECSRMVLKPERGERTQFKAEKVGFLGAKAWRTPM
jgi:hypothetical protein